MERLKEYRLPLAIIVICMTVLCAGFLFFDRSTDKFRLEEEIVEVSLESLLDMNTYEDENIQVIESEFFPLMVDVKGAVVSPGVYELIKGERVDNAIKKAGGLTKEADANAVNFALHVTDEMLIYVPYQGEEGITSAYKSMEAAGEQTEQLININTAEMTVLLELNGIGPQKAQSIIEHRETKGLFKTIEELTEVSGIGLKTLEKIQNQITVN